MIKIKNKKLVKLIMLLSVLMLLIGCADVNKEEDNNQENKEEQEVQDSYKSILNQTLLVSNYNGLELDKLNQYNIEVKFNPEEKTYEASQIVTYINNEDIALKEIYFHIYPNTFREKETAPFLFDSFDQAYPDGFESGYIDINKISLGNKDIDNYAIEGNGKTILKIPLDKELKVGEKININMEYKVKLPPAQDRFGYGDKTFNFGNWYPIAAVYDDEGWNLDPYYSIGDPFYSDTSNYSVTITAPKDIIVASSGNIISEKIEDDNKIWTIESRLMRDFAWVASEHFTKVEETIDGTNIKVYFLDDNKKINDFAAEVSYNSIKTYNKTFGKYPYGQYSVVATSFPSGMEYPGIVFIGEKYYNDAYKGYLEVVIAHETAHQWWYSVVGNDEIDESWLDESITTYSETIYMDEIYGEAEAEAYFNRGAVAGYNRKKSLIQSNETVVKSLKEFTNWNDYGALAYNKGAMFIHEIEQKYGEDKLYQILQQYFKEYRFKIATTEDFIKVCEEVTGDNLDEMVNLWLYNKK